MNQPGFRAVVRLVRPVLKGRVPLRAVSRKSDPSGLAPLVNKFSGYKPPKTKNKGLVAFSSRLASQTFAPAA